MIGSAEIKLYRRTMLFGHQMSETESLATCGHPSFLFDIKWAKIAFRHQLLPLTRGDENLRPEKRREQQWNFTVSIQAEMKQKI
jgi:hypothetical protein